MLASWLWMILGPRSMITSVTFWMYSCGSRVRWEFKNFGHSSPEILVYTFRFFMGKPNFVPCWGSSSMYPLASWEFLRIFLDFYKPQSYKFWHYWKRKLEFSAFRIDKFWIWKGGGSKWVNFKEETRVFTLELLLWSLEYWALLSALDFTLRVLVLKVALGDLPSGSWSVSSNLSIFSTDEIES